MGTSHLSAFLGSWRIDLLAFAVESVCSTKEYLSPAFLLLFKEVADVRLEMLRNLFYIQTHSYPSP